MTRPVVDQFEAPGRAPVGTPLTLRWATQGATAVALTIAADRHALPMAVPAVGQTQLTPHAAGLIHAILHLQSDETDVLGPVMASRFVSVEAAVVRLTLASAVLEGQPGDWLRLHWAAEGAAQVQVKRLAAMRRAPPCGWLDVAVDFVPDEIELCAFDERERLLDRAICRVQPALAGLGRVDAEMQTLERELFEWRTP